MMSLTERKRKRKALPAAKTDVSHMNWMIVEACCGEFGQGEPDVITRRMSPDVIDRVELDVLEDTGWVRDWEKTEIKYAPNGKIAIIPPNKPTNGLRMWNIQMPRFVGNVLAYIKYEIVSSCGFELVLFTI